MAKPKQPQPKPLTRERAVSIVVDAIEYAAFQKGAFAGAEPAKVAQLMASIDLLKQPPKPPDVKQPCEPCDKKKAKR